jgi:predicted RNA binding protein YcfA (HicA-like mRNA interferase family)
MSPPYFAHEIISVLTSHEYRRTESGGGSHEKFVYVDPNTGEKRVVTVPLHEELALGTVDSIAEQAGANDVQAFRDWIDESL